MYGVFGKSGVKLISLVNKLHDLFTYFDLEPIELPKIAVVGSQSSGKTSLIEGIVGKKFLPRGKGIVTRTPIIIQINNLKYGQEEYCIFLHKNDQKYTDFDEIRKELENETNRLAGEKKGISSKPINLKLYLKNTCDLTLVDLPGITKISVEGQKDTTPREIVELVNTIISSSRCLILAISEANVDIANSDSIKIAMKVDPGLTRTIGVLTKIDLVEPEMGILETINGKLIKGFEFIGVINRTEKDESMGITHQQKIEKEEAFFKNNSLYCEIAHKMGTSCLTKLLSEKLINYIQLHLPVIKTSIFGIKENNRILLEKYRNLMDSRKQCYILLDVVLKYTNTIKDLIYGNNISSFENKIEKITEELIGGAKIKKIFTSELQDAIESCDIYECFTEKRIEILLENSEGALSEIGNQEKPFYWVINDCIEKIKPACFKCIENSKNGLVEVMHMSLKLVENETKQFINLNTYLMEASTVLIEENYKKCCVFITNLLEMEASFINFRHPFLYRSKNVNPENMNMEGWIFKRDTKKKAWEKKWLEIRMNTLYYYDSKNDKTPTGLFPLENFIVECQDASSNNLKKNINEGSMISGGSVKVNGKAASTTKISIPKNNSLDFPQPEQEPSTESPNTSYYFRLFHSKKKSAPHKKQEFEFTTDNAHSFFNWKTVIFNSLNKNKTSTKIDEINEIQRTSFNYFEIIKVTIFDTIPKAIFFKLINPTITQIQSKLTEKMYIDNYFDVISKNNSKYRSNLEECKKKDIVISKMITYLNEIN